MSEVNFEEDAPENNVLDTTKKTANAVIDKVNRLSELISQKMELERKASELSEKIKTLEEFELPLAMDEANISQLKLTSGQVLKIKKIFACSLNSENQERGFNWLRENNFGDLIKRNVSVAYGKGQDEEADKLVHELEAMGIKPIDKSSVHHQTLNAFAKEQIEKGKNLPEDIFSVFKGRKAVIASK